MKVVEVPDKLLLPVLTGVCWRFEVPDFWSLEGRAEGAECSIHIICLIPHRAIVHAIDQFDRIPAGERCADCMRRHLLHEHGEPGKQELQEPETDIITGIARSSLLHDHLPVVVREGRDRLCHRGKRALLL